jgi:hypothetical protein
MRSSPHSPLMPVLFCSRKSPISFRRSIIAQIDLCIVSFSPSFFFSSSAFFCPCRAGHRELTTLISDRLSTRPRHCLFGYCRYPPDPYLAKVLAHTGSDGEVNAQVQVAVKPRVWLIVLHFRSLVESELGIHRLYRAWSRLNSYILITIHGPRASDRPVYSTVYICNLPSE